MLDWPRKRKSTPPALPLSIPIWMELVGVAMLLAMGVPTKVVEMTLVCASLSVPVAFWALFDSAESGRSDGDLADIGAERSQSAHVQNAALRAVAVGSTALV